MQLKYRDQHEGPEFHYRSMLRPVASIGYDRVPGILIEPGSDPDGTRRDFYTAEPLERDFIDHLDIELLEPGS